MISFPTMITCGGAIRTPRDVGTLSTVGYPRGAQRLAVPNVLQYAFLLRHWDHTPDCPNAVGESGPGVGFHGQHSVGPGMELRAIDLWLVHRPQVAVQRCRGQPFRAALAFSYGGYGKRVSEDQIGALSGVLKDERGELVVFAALDLAVSQQFANGSVPLFIVSGDFLPIDALPGFHLPAAEHVRTTIPLILNDQAQNLRIDAGEFGNGWGIRGAGRGLRYQQTNRDRQSRSDACFHAANATMLRAQNQGHAQTAAIVYNEEEEAPFLPDNADPITPEDRPANQRDLPKQK